MAQKLSALARSLTSQRPIQRKQRVFGVWRDRELPVVLTVLRRSAAHLEEVAESAQQPRARLGAHARDLESVSTSETASCALRLPNCREAMTRRAGCANRASPDLWEPQGGNPRGSPKTPDRKRPAADDPRPCGSPRVTCLCQAQTSAVSSSPGVFRSCPSDQGRSPALHTPSAPPQGRSPGRKRMPRRIKGRSPARKRMPRRITGRSPARERTPRRIPGRSPARERVKRHIMGRSPALKHWQPPLKSR